MALDYDTEGFTGVLLAAMPAIQDPTFGGSLVLVCAHSDDGAMGLIVNTLAERSEVSATDRNIVALLSRDHPIHLGGPAETDRPFVLHSTDWEDGSDTLMIDRSHALTATPRALAAVATNTGPNRSLIALGYAAWGPGQLESEVLANVWLTLKADPKIVFASACDRKWRAAMGAMGVLPGVLSGATGRA